MERKILFIIFSVVVVLFFAGMVAGNIFYGLAIQTGNDKSAVLQAPHNKLPVPESWKEERQQSQEWFDTIGVQDIGITSYDGLALHGYKIKQKNNEKWAIINHGYTGQGSVMTVFAKELYEQGYNILLPDARGHGKSQGKYVGMGWNDRLDVSAWIKTILEESPSSEILLYGISMGAATVLMASGEPLPSNVKAIVSDCGYSCVKEEFSYQLKQLYGLPAFPFMEFASLVTKMRAGYWLGEADAVKQVAKSKVPILFIHGSADTFVPPYMVEKVYQAAVCEKDIYIVEGAGHGMSAAVAKDKYWEKVENFASKYI